MMAVLDLFQRGVELSLQLPGDAAAEDLADFVRGEAPQPDFARPFEDTVNGESPLEDEIATILDLIDGVEPAHIHGAPFAFGEFWPQQQSPVVQPLADHFACEPIGSALQSRYIVHGQKGIVIFAVADLSPVQSLLDEGVTVEVVGGLEREERCHAHHHRPQGFIPQVEIVMREAAPLLAQNAVVGVLGGELGQRTTEGRSLLHALEDEIYAVLSGLLHAARPRPHVILLADALPGPFHRGVGVAGERLDPSPILTGPFAQRRLIHHRNPFHVAEKVHHLLGARQSAQISVDDDAVEAVVYQEPAGWKTPLRKVPSVAGPPILP